MKHFIMMEIVMSHVTAIGNCCPVTWLKYILMEIYLVTNYAGELILGRSNVSRITCLLLSRHRLPVCVLLEFQHFLLWYFETQRGLPMLGKCWFSGYLVNYNNHILSQILLSFSFWRQLKMFTWPLYSHSSVKDQDVTRKMQTFVYLEIMLMEI